MRYSDQSLSSTVTGGGNLHRPFLRSSIALLSLVALAACSANPPKRHAESATGAASSTSASGQSTSRSTDPAGATEDDSTAAEDDDGVAQPSGVCTVLAGGSKLRFTAAQLSAAVAGPGQVEVSKIENDASANDQCYGSLLRGGVPIGYFKFNDLSSPGPEMVIPEDNFLDGVQEKNFGDLRCQAVNFRIQGELSDNALAGDCQELPLFQLNVEVHPTSDTSISDAEGIDLVFALLKGAASARS